MALLSCCCTSGWEEGGAGEEEGGGRGGVRGVTENVGGKNSEKQKLVVRWTQSRAKCKSMQTEVKTCSSNPTR